MDFYLYNKNLATKLTIIYFTSLNNIVKINNDPIPFLISKFSDIEAFYEDKKFTKIIYFVFDTVHNLLYDLDKIIQINEAMCNDLCFNYYLILLIRAGEDIINYEFVFNYINLFYNKIKNKENIYYNIISYKIIIELINNYKN